MTSPWKKENTNGTLDELVAVVRMLRHPEKGCPWDLEQTHESLRSYLIEEASEAVQAIDEKDPFHIAEELGDVLLQVVLHAQLGEEAGTFSLADIIKSITDKMIRRHPHVFKSTVNAKDSKEVLEHWEKQKSKENSASPGDLGFSEKLKSLPAHLPSLLRAERIGEKCARNSFDWDTLEQVVAKVSEEFEELREAINALSSLEKASSPLSLTDRSKLPSKERNHLEEEIGDLFFTLAQLSRWIGTSAEDLSRLGCNKFISRVKMMEESLNVSLNKLSPEEKQQAWDKAKTKLTSQNNPQQ